MHVQPLLRTSLRAACIAALAVAAGCGSASSKCARDSDCGFGQLCSGSGCFRPSQFCADAHHAMNDRGEWTDCYFYFCENNTCPRTADSSGQCTNGALLGPMGIDPDRCYCPAQTPCGGTAEAPPTYDLSGYATCAKDSDCKSDEMCWRSPWDANGAYRCVKNGSYCDFNADGAVSVTPSGTPDSTSGMKARDSQFCGIYQCEPVTGQCYTDCITGDDCRPGYNCDVTSWTCVAAG